MPDQLLSADPTAGQLLSADPNAGMVRPMNTATVNGQPVDVPTDEGAGAFASHFAQQINPVPLGQLLPFPQALGGAGMDAPKKAVENLLHSQRAVFDKAKEAHDRGDNLEALRHGLNWLIPVLGPVIDKAADEIKAGKYAAGAGDTLGLAASLFGPAAATELVKSGLAAKVATAAEKGSVNRAVETLAPTVGPNKVRLANQMADAAPTVLRETNALTRSGVLDQAGVKLQGAYDALDAAYDAVPNTRMYPTAPIKAALAREIRNLSVSGIGGTVQPANRASRIAALTQAQTEVGGMGNLANIDNLRKLRIAWDEGAKAQFTPSIAADYLKARGTGAGWADARTALNDFLTSQHPELEPLNADATVWKRAVDAMQAADETDRARPKVGRTIMARGLGAAAGGEMGGGKGLVAGAVLGPLVERIVSSAQPAMKLTAARQLAALSDALQAGQTGKAQSLLGQLQTLARSVTVKAAQVGSGALAPMSVMPQPAVAAASQP